VAVNVDSISFYFPDRKALEGRDVATLDPDRDWELFGTGLYIWILQTFLRLRMAGAPVRLEEAPPGSGVVVAHADHVERLLADASSPADLIVVCARADRWPQVLADVEIVQNSSSVEDCQIFIPSWLQPGLIPRDPSRSTHVEAIAYMGTSQQLHAELATAAWEADLLSRGLYWDNRMATFLDSDQVYSQHRWNDYSAVDVVVALRPPSIWNARSKPAAKLQNAWAAGVPAILSPEVPYRELRRSPLDYLEAESGADVLAALERLRADPDLYAGMVQNGLERAREFQPDRLIARWMDVLWREIPARAGARGHRLLARARGHRALARRARRRWTAILHRLGQ
jgi:hypothetical protein